MGALVASFYGAGIDMDRLYKLSTAFKRKYFWTLQFQKWALFQEKSKRIYQGIYPREKY